MDKSSIRSLLAKKKALQGDGADPAADSDMRPHESIGRSALLRQSSSLLNRETSLLDTSFAGAGASHSFAFNGDHRQNGATISFQDSADHYPSGGASSSTGNAGGRSSLQRMVRTQSKLFGPGASMRAKPSGLFSSLVASVRRFAADDKAEDAREDEQAAMEAYALRTKSMSSIRASMHPARQLHAHQSFTSFSSHMMSAVPRTRVVLTNSRQQEQPQQSITSDKRQTEDFVTLAVEPVSTIGWRHKLSFFCDGVPPAMAKTPELRPLIVPTTIVVYLTVAIALLSCTMMCVETLPRYEVTSTRGMDPTLKTITAFCVVWLTIDWIMRVISAPSWFALFTNPLMYCDLMANIPLYIEFLSGERIARFLVILRLFRLMRVLQVSRSKVGMQAVFGAFRKSVSGLLLFLFLLTVILFIGSALVYIAEQTETTFNVDKELWFYDVDELSPFQSLLHTLWFVMQTITTVGYGDIVVHSGLAKAVASLLMMIGPFAIAFPTVILASNFEVTHQALREELEDISDVGVKDIKQRQRATLQFAQAIKQFVPDTLAEERRTRDQLLYRYAEKSDLSYTPAVGAGERAIVLKDGVALYSPLLMLRCARRHGEPEYGFQSKTAVFVTVRDNFPNGAVVKFNLLLHTAMTQEAATMAVHKHLRANPELDIAVSAVAPRPIRTLRVTFSSDHSLLHNTKLLCSKFHNPFGSIALEVLVPKAEAVAVLLRYSSSCKFLFRCEYHDGMAMTNFELEKFHTCNVAYDGVNRQLMKVLEDAFPQASP